MSFFLRSTSCNLQVKLATAVTLVLVTVTSLASAQQRSAAATTQGSSGASVRVEESASAATNAASAKAKPKWKPRAAPTEPVAAEAESGGDEVDLNVMAVPGPVAPKEPKRRTKSKQAAAKRVPRERQPTAEYVKMRDSWHAPVEQYLTPTLKVTGRPPLVLSRVLGGDAPVTLVPQRDDGGFSDEDLERASTAFCPKEAKKIHAISPRLLDLVYRAMLHFKAPLVHVVSGYRPDRAGSRHTQGRAIDFVLPGVTNEQLADYARTYGFVGVGIYPKSGFVHLDVRDTSYFWVDNSLPDERSRGIPVLPNLAVQADRAAAARGDAPDTWVPDNDREDRAAAKSYARRAKVRRDRALRQQSAAAAPANASSDSQPAKSAAAKPKTPAFNAAGMLD
ncbi:MAG TPA: DUF882 domain-containing protein [Polyangiales bacterium]|nr:DUF882 domain-containing protein [Polyangiales bacterium]